MYDEDIRVRQDVLIEECLAGPFVIADIMPARVPEAFGARYFEAEAYFREPERLSLLYQKMARILLKLSCYCHVTASFDGGKTWEEDPKPENLSRGFLSLVEKGYFRALFPAEKTMIDIDSGDTYMTIFCSAPEFLKLIQKLAQAEGFFVWAPSDL